MIYLSAIGIIMQSFLQTLLKRISFIKKVLDLIIKNDYLSFSATIYEKI